MYETMKEDYNDKYEYIFPEITLDKNLISDEKLGYLDLQLTLKFIITILINNKFYYQ